MNVKSRGRLARLGWRGKGKRPPSIVLLLREAHVFTTAELRGAGEKGWGKSFDGVDPAYTVTEEAGGTFLRAGGCVVEVTVGYGPFVANVEGVAGKLPDEVQQRAWRAHGAWAALDLRCEDMKKVEAYAGLARFALQLGDHNCTAVYLPGENVFLPNDGSAEEALRLMVGGMFLRKRFGRLRR